ncbi:MAG: general secretion pathway protein GspF, partial [Cellvibrionales bacterium TMED148]
LQRLADAIETSAENRKTIARALIYPMALLATSLIVVVIMMIWVVPKITIIFANSDRELPLVTQLVMGLSNFTTEYGIYVLVIFFSVLLFFKKLLQNVDKRRRWHQIVVGLPFLGRWIYIANIADWARSLGVLLSNGVPALAALKISSGVLQNTYLQGQLEAVTEAMRQGSSLQKALDKNLSNSGFLVQMVASGEASSELDKMLLRVSDYYALRLRNAVDVFMKLINPILIILMGLVILSVVAAVMLPIMDMNNMI